MDWAGFFNGLVSDWFPGCAARLSRPLAVNRPRRKNARAVVVLDENDQVLHSELVGEIKDEPDYAAAIAALGK